MDGGSIAGLTIGVLLIVLGVVALVVIFILSFRKWRRKQSKHRDTKTNNPPHTNKLDTVFRMIDNKLRSKKHETKTPAPKTSTDQESRSATNKGFESTEFVIEITDDSGECRKLDTDKAEDCGELEDPESPIRRSANTYSEIDLGDDGRTMRF